MVLIENLTGLIRTEVKGMDIKKESISLTDGREESLLHHRYLSGIRGKKMSDGVT